MKNPLRLAALSTLLLTSMAHAAEPLTIDVHRDAHCGCCKHWIAHLQSHGLKVIDHVEDDMSRVKEQLGVEPRLASCHTGVINGKFVEGHVPAEHVIALSTRADLKGIAVPGMPIGSPGMEMGDQKDAFQVIGLRNDGRDEGVATYPGH